MKKVMMMVLLAATVPARAGALIDLAAEASRPAVNDMVRATVYSEVNGANPAELARRVNADVAEAIKLVRSHASLTVKSGQQTTFPVYGPSRKIDNWRMRSELIIESRDPATVSEVLGKLQQMRLVVGDLAQMPSPETRRKVEDEAMRDAIQAFQNRAAVAAEQLGKTWKVKQMNIQQGGGMPIPMMRAARGMAMAADAAPVPVEAGESLISTQVRGQIELSD